MFHYEIQYMLTLENKTKEQKRSVWILAAVITIAVTIFSFIFKDMNILGIFA